AHYAGIPVRWVTVAVMAMSGALAGLGGAIETQGVIGRYEPGFNASLGFDGITIALLAKAHPRSAIPAAFLVAILRAGSSKMQADTRVEPEIIDVLLAVILLLVAAPIVLRTLLRMRGDHQQDELRLTAGWGS
ncbi:MAG: ABC transporter permease subunit, partial [Acidimicrobiales bacterium]